MITFEILTELAGPIGLLCVLSVGMGEIQRSLASPVLAQCILGAVFGGVAVLEMNMPIKPFEGLIIDLRIVAIVLAGAFLDWRGLAVCLTIAAATRLHIGGVGMIAGVVSMLISGYSGALWQRMTRGISQRGWRHLGMLGLMQVFTFVPIVFLPREMAFWFLTTAAPWLFLTYMLVLPTLAALLQRQTLRIDSELLREEELAVDPDSGLLRPASFLRETVQLAVSSPPGTVGGIMVVSPTFQPWILRLWGPRYKAHVQSALALKLAKVVTHSSLVGLSHAGNLLVPLSRSETLQEDKIDSALSALCAQNPMKLAGGPTFVVNAKTRVLPVQADTDLHQLLTAVDVADRLPFCDLDKPVQPLMPPVAAKLHTTENQTALFSKLEAVLAVSRGAALDRKTRPAAQRTFG